MASLRRLISLAPTALQITTPCLMSASVRPLSTGCVLMKERFVLGKSKTMSATELRGKIVDESDNVTANIEALVAADATETEAFKLYPDETTADTLYNGIKYKDLPFVTIVCQKNNTKFYAYSANEQQLFFMTPAFQGFMNAKKRTNVAAQATGLAVGQKFRSLNIRTVRVRIDGFNAGRIAAFKGIVQAGINIVSVSDCTKIDWGWTQRAQKRKRRN